MGLIENRESSPRSLLTAQHSQAKPTTHAYMGQLMDSSVDYMSQRSYRGEAPAWLRTEIVFLVIPDLPCVSLVNLSKPDHLDGVGDSSHRVR